MEQGISAEYARRLYHEASELWEVLTRSASGLRKVRAFYRAVLSAATANLPIIFTSAAARLNYILNTGIISPPLERELQLLYHFFHSRTLRAQIPALSILRTLVNLIAVLSPEPIPESLAQRLESIPSALEFEPELPQTLTFFAGVVQQVSRKEGFPQLTIHLPGIPSITVQLHPPWTEFHTLVWTNAVVHGFQLAQVSSAPPIYRTTEQSAIILEPDYLVDATELTVPFHHHQFSLLKLLASWLESPLQFRLPLLQGKIVNECLDLMLLHPEWSDLQIFQAALEHHLPTLYLVKLNEHPETLIQQLENHILSHLPAIRSVIQQYQDFLITVEPTFCAPDYGLVGRLDFLAESQEDSLRKDVVELKSGKPPPVPLALSDIQSSIIRPEHRLQASAYNLLLDSVYPKRRGISAILYSQSDSSQPPLRDVPNTWKEKLHVIKQRNAIVHFHYRLATKRFDIDKALSYGIQSGFSSLPPYLRDKLLTLIQQWYELSTTEKVYFHHLLRFIFRERWSSFRAQSNFRTAFSQLWNTSLEDKRSNFDSLTDLRIRSIDTTSQPIEIHFERTLQSAKPVQLREGDRVFVYPQTLEQATPQHHPLLRGVISSLSPSTVTVQLLNPLIPHQWFKQWTHWILDPDFNLSLHNRLLTTLALLLHTDSEWRKKILGLSSPRPMQLTKTVPSFSYLTPRQQELVERCVQSPDYFLAIGPPGSGKTSRFLRALVEEYAIHQQKRILLLTYTNRAADEICEVLQVLNLPFLRLGSAANTTFAEATIEQLINEHLPTHFSKQDRERIQSILCVVSTASSILGLPEILSQRFDVVIVDEASQLLEVHLAGIISQCQKFILIGDDRQLPAVVQQAAESNDKLDPKLRQVGFASFHESLFERLLRQARQNQWHWCYGTLTEQGRLHEQIQQLVNELFYHHQLRPLHSRQFARYSPLVPGSTSIPILQYLHRQRVIFIPTRPQGEGKHNTEEAQWIAQLVETLAHVMPDFPPDRLGIIAPFREQIALIHYYLNPKLATVITIDTVERFQGTERDIIILSLCANSLSLLERMQSLNADHKVDRKLNVAITRAREHLIIFGSPSVLEHSPIYSRLLKLIRQQGGYIEHPEHFFPIEANKA